MRRSVVLGSMVLWVLSLVSLGWPMAKDVADIEATLNSEKDGFTSEKATKDINEQIVKLSKSTIGNVWLKMSAPKQIRPGFTAPIDISIWNIGGQVIQNLVVLSRAPNFMDVNIGDSLYTWLVSGSIRSTGPTIDTTIIDVNASSQKLKTITWHVPELPIAVNPEDTIKLHYELLVDSTLTSSIKLKNDIILTSQGQFLLSDVVVMEILLLPDFQVRKWANFDVLHPGQVGQFTICYRNNGYKDAEDVRIWDVLPEGLTFLDTLYLSHADTFWIIPGPPDTLVWFDYVVPKYAGGETGWHYIRFPFRVDVSRSDCPVNLLNEGALVWGKRTFPFRTRIAVITEPDIVPKILSLKTDRPRSPGRLVSIQAFIKNIGGTNVTSNFKVKFSYSKWNNGLQKPIPIEKTIVTCSPQAPLPAGGQDSVLVSVSTLWVPPGLGRYSIYVNADCDSQITEIHEVDPTYPFNNIDSTEVIVGVDSINVNIMQLSLLDTIPKSNATLRAGFPNYIFSYVTVTDQNDNHILGLADTTNWLGSGDVANIGVRVDSLWLKLLEYHREDKNLPSDPNIYHTQPPLQVTEVTRTIGVSLPGARISAALVMDYSGSMSSQDIKGAERAAKAFVREMTPNDKAAIIKFGSTVAVVQHLTSDTTQLINAIEAPSPVTGMTALLDAIYQGVSEVLNETGRKMVIVYTDGWENSSYNSLPQIIEYAQRNNVPVYTIGYGDADIQTLMQIANMTGGEYHYSTDWAEIERIYATLGKLVKNFYVLAHATTDPNEDGSWRTVDITVNYFGITGQDTAHYRAPFKGIDLWVTQASFPDSVNKKGVISKYARPGETYFYTLTYGNDGSLPAQNVTIVNKLPAHITSVDSISPIPTSSNLDQIIWNIGEVPPRGSGTFTFSVTVDTLMPPYFVPLYDSVLITCIGDDVDSTNNIAVDTVFALPGVVPPPQIMVEPQVVFSLDSVKIKIWTSTPLNRWDIWIQYPDGTVDSSKYSGEISNFRQNRTPLMPDTPPLPDDWLVIEPSFHDTRKFTESDTEQYRAILHYEDYFNLQGEVSDTFWVKSNGLRPDLIARLEPLARDKSRSPGKPIDIRAYIKNMGGTDVTDSFVVAFSYANLDNIPLRWLVMERDTVVCSPQSPLLARSQDSILVTVSPSWVPPGMGNFRVYAYVDCDSQITEGHDVDTTFAFNNIDSTDVTVKIDSLIVNITQISRSDTIGRDNVIGGFPSYIFSYLTVTDQNNNPIKGLADSIKWLGSNDTTGTGDLVSSLWQPLVEYYRDDRNRPVLQDLYQMQPSIQITEVTETQSATLSFARMSVALVMDYSGNMSHQDIDEAKQAAKAFVQQMVPADKVAVLKYASTVAVVQSLTSDRTAIYNAIDTEPQLGTGTALLDAIHRAVTELLHESGRKMVLIFSAGPDNSSYNTVPYTIEYVQRSNIPVFTIGYGSANVSVLKTIANMTGGQYYYSKSWGEIEEICSTIANTLKSFYILGHATTDPDENGTWRTVDVTLNYAGVKGQDVGYYLAPYAGRDMRITETSYPDSINTEAKLAKYVKPGETFSYVLIYENIGNLPAQKVRIVKFLPDSVTVTGNFNHAPDIQTQEQLVWEVGEVPPNGKATISFDITVNPIMPPWVVPLYDSVVVFCEDDRDTTNNVAVDTVFVLPKMVPSPQIMVEPKEVAPLDTVTIKVFTYSPLQWWDIWILYPDGHIDSTEYSNQIANFVTQRTPLMPDTPPLPGEWLIIDPPFTNTRKWTENEIEEFKVILRYEDWFNLKGEAFDVFRVCIVPGLRLEKNLFRPGLDEDMTIIFSLIKDSDVKINIYNIAGELVKKLIDQRFLAARHYTHWDGRDDNGRTVGSGVYIFVMEAGSFKDWKKVIVVR